MRLTRFLAAIPLGLLAGCGGAADERPESDRAMPAAANAVQQTLNEALPVPTPTPSPLPAAAPIAAPRVDPLAFDRLGKLRVGATLAKMKRDGVIVEVIEDPVEEGGTCTFARFKGLPDVAAMLGDDMVARIDVWSPDHPTLGGVRVGQSEAEAVRRLGGRVRIEPHPYTGPDGHYLIVHEEEASRGLILESDGKTIESYRFGEWGAVQMIEGCV